MEMVAVAYGRSWTWRMRLSSRECWGASSTRAGSSWPRATACLQTSSPRTRTGSTRRHASTPPTPPPPHPRRLHPTHAASTPPTPPPHPTPRHIRSQARFAAEIKARCELLELAPSADYRRALAAAAEPSFFTPLDERAAAAVEARFAQLSRGAAVPTRAAVSFGRTMPLLACDAAGVARLSFEEACGGHYGAADYIALAQAYHTLVLTGVPRMSLNQRDKARRFIVFVDQLYNHKTRLIASAAVPVEDLFSGAAGWQDHGATLEGLEFEGEAGKAAELNPIGVTANSVAVARQTGNVSADSRKGLTADTLFTGEDESFAFTRAISRLCEMQSSAYLGARPRDSA
jgi:predicted ATPase